MEYEKATRLAQVRSRNERNHQDFEKSERDAYLAIFSLEK